MKALIVAGGGAPSQGLIQEALQEGFDFVIAADRGAQVLLDYALDFQLLVGDLDSLDEASLNRISPGTEIIKLPAEKDFSDTEAAYREAVQRGAQAVLILGATGTRQDHFMANLGLLNIALTEGIPAALADDHNHIFLAKGPLDIEKRQGWNLSFFAIGPDVADFSVSNVKYPLEHHCLSAASTRTVSNAFLEGPAHISFSQGVVLVMLSRD